MQRLLDFYERRATKFASRTRERLGYPGVARLDRGRPGNGADCPISRTIAPGRASTGWAMGMDPLVKVEGREFRMPVAVRRFVVNFDKGRYPHLKTYRPLRTSSARDLIESALPASIDADVTPERSSRESAAGVAA